MFLKMFKNIYLLSLYLKGHLGWLQNYQVILPFPVQTLLHFLLVNKCCGDIWFFFSLHKIFSTWIPSDFLYPRSSKTSPCYVLVLIVLNQFSLGHGRSFNLWIPFYLSVPFALSFSSETLIMCMLDLLCLP